MAPKRVVQFAKAHSKIIKLVGFGNSGSLQYNIYKVLVLRATALASIR